jgi:hypothetical protein
MIIKEGNIYEIGMKHGNYLTVTTDGTALVSQYISGELSGEVIEVGNGSPVTVGPLLVDSQWQIDALSGTATIIKAYDGVICRVIKTADSGLPTYENSVVD